MKTNYNFRTLIFTALFFPAFVFAQTSKEPNISGIANAKDSDSSQRNSYLNDIVTKKPGGDFIHYLG